MTRPTDDPQIRQQLAALRRRCERVVGEDELAAKLLHSRRSGRPLRIKLGMDPTAPDVTLGHTVPLRVIRQFQDWGHTAVLIIGDATAAVGDPTGRNTTRPLLTPAEIDANAQTYVEQVGKVLLTGEEHLEVRRNSEWLGELDLAGVIKLLARKTLAQVLERDDFRQRYESGTEVHLHELVYPLLQGWDSVAVRADVEFGGSDQLFNNLVGRDFQKAEGQDPQVVVVTPLLVGTDGHAKMSKSKGNYVALTDPAGGDGGMFGKVMSLPDAAMADYFRLVTDVPEDEYQSLVDRSPRDAKVRLAKHVVVEFHDAAAADAAEKQFMTATHGGIPDDVPERPIGRGPHGLAALLVEVGFAQSNGEAMRLVKQGGVKLDGEKQTDPKAQVTIDQPIVLQAGKRKFVRLTARA